ncbi:hypothetical protein OJAV_G00177960 [Oryzias javanicus]|uniref:Uncharacterized protein n=1 Tax=Oryzias javanicus TaxID=123683 RepID=A0A437CBJ6_ORYJA|nr:hypothetical protein OJAV_G00177960 [Oryzias javanicus]
MGTDMRFITRSAKEGLKIFIQSVSVRFEYYRSVEYCSKRRRTKPPQCTSLLSKGSKEMTPGGLLPNQQLRSQKPNTSMNKAAADHLQEWDLIDLINSTSNAEYVSEGTAETPDPPGGDQSQEVCDSEGCSPASGSVFHHHDGAQKPKPVHHLCTACHQLYQTVKRHRAPIKDKLLDNDPTSLTCDQWVLIKKWLPRKPPLSSRLSRGDSRIFPVRRQQRVGAGDHVTCSRPHMFLQRNLRRCTRLLAEKEGKTKKRQQRRAGSRTFVGY